MMGPNRLTELKLDVMEWWMKNPSKHWAVIFLIIMAVAVLGLSIWGLVWLFLNMLWLFWTIVGSVGGLALFIATGCAMAEMGWLD